MRHLLTSFLALHWAVVFALLGFICIDGSRGLSVAISVLGLTVNGDQLSHLESGAVVGPLAVAFMLVAVLFCWAFVEIFVNDSGEPETADGVIRIAFIAAGFMLLLVLVFGAAQGIEGLFLMVAVHMAALVTSYLATVAERWTAYVAHVPDRSEIRAAARGMAQGAAHGSRLARTVGQPGSRSGKRH